MSTNPGISSKAEQLDFSAFPLRPILLHNNPYFIHKHDYGLSRSLRIRVAEDHNFETLSTARDRTRESTHNCFAIAAI